MTLRNSETGNIDDGESVLLAKNNNSKKLM